jgi:hypothetical protein
MKITMSLLKGTSCSKDHQDSITTSDFEKSLLLKNVEEPAVITTNPHRGINIIDDLSEGK